ncbi:LmeA family phospholipid-binding protein [Rhodococcus sp. NPDC003348]
MASTTHAPAASTRPKRNRVLTISLVVIVALVAVLIGGELYVRHNVKQCMADQFQSQLGSQVDVGLSAKPVLLQAVDKKVPYITITSDDSSFGPAKDMHVVARVNDVDLTTSDTSGGTIGSSTADVDWSTAGIAATIQGEAFGTLVTGVTSDQSAGTLQFQVLGNLAELTVKPTVSDGVVRVETIGAEIFGLGLPTDLVSGVVNILTSSLQTFPLGMTAQSITVTDSGLQLSLAGGAYTMPAPQPGAQAPDSCSVLM